ncbi:MAG: hypothetical protein IT532_17215 [Burkholderiales bacterium]|nr:hypothetical protein [Burkholderiales bacterium]
MVEIVAATDADGALIAPQWLGRVRGARSLDLDSGPRRQQAHGFYFCEGFAITSFYFKKALS